MAATAPNAGKQLVWVLHEGLLFEVLAGRAKSVKVNGGEQEEPRNGIVKCPEVWGRGRAWVAYVPSVSWPLAKWAYVWIELPRPPLAPAQQR